jgi:hypothetical protein
MRSPRFRGSSRARHLIVAGALTLLGAAAVPAMGTTGPTAELLGDNLFMGTTKVEVGARPDGSFGSAIDAPAGYSPLTDRGAILGFRVNPAECTWTDPGCVTLGDFFTPGTPYEAWGIQIGNGTPGFNSIFGTSAPGAFTSADAAGVTGVWQSAGAFDGAIAVKQTYSIPPYAWMIDTTVELTNTSGAAVDDVYFMRGVDPDNCRMETRPLCDQDGDGVPDNGPSFATHNTVVAQGSATTSALVTATQTNDSYIGLRAIGDEARAFTQNGGFNNPGDLSTLWSEGDPQYRSSLGSSFGDDGIYAVVRVPSIAPGETATVRIQYVVREIPAAVDITEPVVFDGGLIDVAALNGPDAVLQGICTDASHGTAVPEDGKVRYTPVPGFSGTDSFTYSTGGPCGTFTLSVAPAPAEPAPAEPAPTGTAPTGPGVVLLGAAQRTTLASGRLRMAQRLRFNRTGRYTFIFKDPATGKRVLQYRGSRVGARLLSKTFNAPVVVTSKEGKTLTLVSIFNRNLSAKLKKTMTMRIVLKSPDGPLSDATR